MAEGVAYLAVSAVGEETTPNIAVNATQRIPYLEWAATPEVQHLMDMALQGQIAQATPELGFFDIRGTWRCNATYTQNNLLLKHFIGSLASNTYTFVDSLVGKALTWPIDKQVSIWELSGVKLPQLVLNWGPDGVSYSGTSIAQGIAFNSLTYTAGTISADSTDNSINDSATSFPAFVAGDKITIQGFTGSTSNNGVGIVVSRTTAKIVISELTLTTDAAGESVTIYGGQNTAAELAALLPNTDTRIKIAPDLNTRLGLYSAALGVGDEIKAVEGTLTLTRPMVEQHVSGQRGILEPAPNNFVAGIFSLTLSRFSTNQYELWKITRQRLSLRVYFKKEGGTASQEWIMPNVVLVTTPSPISGPGFIPQTITGTIHIGQDKYGPSTVTSASTTDDSFNTTANDFPMLYPGAKLFVSGFVSAANNGVHTVVSRTVSKIIVTTNLTTEAAGPSVTLVGRNPFVIVNETA